MFYPTYTRPYARHGDPFAMMRSLLGEVDRDAPTGAAPAGFPAVNVWQGDDAVAVTAELAGIEPADVDISVKDTVLTISGERKPPEVPDDARWHRNERGYGKFTRAIRLPFAATEDKIEARMTNGVLRVVVGRPEQDKPRKIEIKAA